MKKIMMLLSASAILATIAFTAAEPLPIGSEMPKASHKMKSVNGKEITIKDVLKDKGVLVIFSCNTCPFVLKNEERINAICGYAESNNMGVIILNSNEAYRSGEDSYDAMKEYATEKKYAWDYVVDKDHEIADAFGAKRTPECFLFDKNLKLVYHGAIDDNPSDVNAVTRQHLREAINELSNNKDITVKESKSVGCTIKRNK